MKALLMIDFQNGFIQGYEEMVKKTHTLAKTFKDNNDKVIAFKHIENIEGSPIKAGTDGAEIPASLSDIADVIIDKKFAISFKGTELQSYLEMHDISELYITGFNMEFCILFTSITAADRGYDVTVIEDLCGTVNKGDTYEMNGLDINDFVGTVIDWSGVIKNLYLKETEFNI
jgi:nicotinamidase-related amidase